MGRVSHSLTMTNTALNFEFTPTEHAYQALSPAMIQRLVDCCRIRFIGRNYITREVIL